MYIKLGHFVHIKLSLFTPKIYFQYIVYTFSNISLIINILYLYYMCFNDYSIHFYVN